MFSDLVRQLKSLNLPFGGFVIVGSGPMAVRGLKDPHDIDVLVKEDIYREYLLKDGWKEQSFDWQDSCLSNHQGIELWKSWGPGKWDVEKLISGAEIIDGLPYMRLEDFIEYKNRQNREKDKEDFKKIQDWTSQQS